MPIDSVRTLVQMLDQYHLLEPLQYHELTRTLQGSFTEPLPLSRELVQRGWLTPYQVNNLFQGKENLLTLGSYVLQERISEGHMGAVFKARHMHMRRTVALQVIRGEVLSDSALVERFYAEVQVASQLSHPHIVASFDAGPAGDTHFFAMEYIEGIDLERHVEADGPLAVIQACEFIRQSALGLQHAFQRGLRHHDINPSNILLIQPRNAPDSGSSTTTSTSVGALTWGHVKVRNLGLTVIRHPIKHTKLDSGKPRETPGFGSPDYIAPERAAGQPGDIRSEIYGLGCTFYYLLTGQVPFPEGTPEEKYQQHAQVEPTPVEDLRPAVPAEVRAIIAKMLAKRPEQRYQTPGEVAMALASLPAHALTASAAEGKAWEKRRAVQRRRTRQLIVGSGIGLLIGLALFTWLLLSKLGGTTSEKTTPEVKTQPAAPALAARPALSYYCGRNDGWSPVEAISPGYTVRRTQGGDAAWGTDPTRTFAWIDGDQIKIMVQIPTGTHGELRLFCLDADAQRRRENLTVLGKTEEVDGFTGKGKEVKFPLAAADLRDGQVEVVVKNLPNSPNAVISRVEFYPIVPPDAPPPSGPAFLIQCGRGNGSNQEEIVTKGYRYRRLNNNDQLDNWGNAVKPHAWFHGQEVRFQLELPPGTRGQLRLLLSDPDNNGGGRKVKWFVNNRTIGEYANYQGPNGLWVSTPLSPSEIREGKLEVVLQNLNPASNAALSTIEFVPTEK